MKKNAGKFYIILLIIFSIFPIYQVNAGTTNAGTDSTSQNGNVDKVIAKTIQNLENKLNEQIPEPIKNAVYSTIDILENFRDNISNVSENKQQEIKTELETLKNNENSKESSNKFLKPFKYAELLFFSLISFVFNNKWGFYGLSAVVLFFILRYLWHLFF